MFRFSYYLKCLFIIPTTYFNFRFYSYSDSNRFDKSCVHVTQNIIVFLFTSAGYNLILNLNTTTEIKYLFRAASILRGNTKARETGEYLCPQEKGIL